MRQNVEGLTTQSCCGETTVYSELLLEQVCHPQNDLPLIYITMDCRSWMLAEGGEKGKLERRLRVGEIVHGSCL